MQLADADQYELKLEISVRITVLLYYSIFLFINSASEFFCKPISSCFEISCFILDSNNLTEWQERACLMFDWKNVDRVLISLK